MMKLPDTKKLHRSVLATLVALLLAAALGVAVAPSAILAAADTAPAASGASVAAASIEAYGGADSSAVVPVYEAPADPVPTPASPSTVADGWTATPAAVSGGSGSDAGPIAWADATPPVISGLTPADGSLIGPAATFSASYSDPEPSVGIKLSTIMLHIDNRHQFGCTITDTSITCNKSGLSDGSHKLEAFACDTSFNCSTATWYVTVDALAPAISSTQPTGTINNNSATVTASFSDSGAGVDPASAIVTLDGAAMAGCSVTAAGVSCPAAGLSDGAHTAHMDVADLLGNRATQSWAFSVAMGAIGVTGQSPADGTWLADPSPQVKVDFATVGSGVIDPAGVTLLIDGVDVSVGADCQPAGISYIPAPHLEDGWHTVSVSVHDDAGHSGDSSWTFAVDTTPPAIAATTPTGTAEAKATIAAAFSDSGSGIDPLSASLSVDGHDDTAAATVSAAGISYVPSEAMAAGSHSVQLSVSDLAGNQQTVAWSFDTAAAPQKANTAPTSHTTTPTSISTAGSPATMTEYWINGGPIAVVSSGGTWSITGFQASANAYYLPWYDSPADSGQPGAQPADEIRLKNTGAGEAIINIFVAGERRWEGKVAEGGTETASMAGITGGPVKIICPSGQSLEVSRQIKNSDGTVSSTPAVPEENLEPELLLARYEAPAADQGSELLLIANPAQQEAAVDVYVGDPAAPESLKGHYTIGPNTAARSDLPDVSGGPVRIVSRNGQPLVASIEHKTIKSAAAQPAPPLVLRSELLATGLTRLESTYVINMEADQTGAVNVRPARLFIANPNQQEISVELRVDGELVNDPGNPESSQLVIASQNLITVDLAGLPAGSVEIACPDCILGEGLLAAAAS